jgi:putative phosphoribosyl transferase
MFKDRHEAGVRLAKALAGFKGRKDAIILAIPRGALQIGEVLHERLHLPLDIIITKKIPHPMNDEFAIGAVASGGISFLNDPSSIEVPMGYVERKIDEIGDAIDSRYKRYRGEKAPPLALEGKTVILVDDGIATGSTMRIAIRVLRAQKPALIVVAVPVGAKDAIESIRPEADEVICLEAPEPFFAIGQFYQSFPQVEDEEAIAILKRCQSAAKTKQGRFRRKAP